tara:strand:- start:723 stop:1895 length:1173 start_codon:yes stop_codon:yes gene_type:complete
MEFIDLKAQQQELMPEGISLRKSIDQRIKTVLDHGKYILGPEVNELEEKLANFVGVNHCVGVSSGTDALLISLMALGIKRGDEVITTPFSFFSTVETILLLGAKPVFVDIEELTYNINPKLIKEAISNKTKAIIAVSLYGQPANFLEINKIGRKYDIPIIEDGAQSFGSSHHKSKSCGLSTIGTTSFFPSKPLGCYGDGGACFTNDKELAKNIKEISIHGQNKRYSHNQIGLNGRLDTIQAAILLAKLDLFEAEVEARIKIGARYTEKLKGKGFDKTPFISYENSSVYAQYTIQVNNREKVIENMKSKGIPTAVHYPSLLTDQRALRCFNFKNKNFIDSIFSKEIYKSYDINNAKKAARKVLSLPMHPNLSEKNQNLVINSLMESLPDKT